MVKINNIKSLVVALAVGCMPMLASAINAVVVTDADGEETVFALADKPKVTFSAEALVITAGDGRVEYPIDKGAKFTFEQRDLSSISDVESGSAVFVIGDVVEARGLKAGSAVAAYSADGRLIASAAADSEGNASLDLSHAHGAIIISTTSKTIKIIK